jgi:hypothetical protein
VHGLPGDVELILAYDRYITAPGSGHHTGGIYRLYNPNGSLSRSLLLPCPNDVTL